MADEMVLVSRDQFKRMQDLQRRMGNNKEQTVVKDTPPKQDEDGKYQELLKRLVSDIRGELGKNGKPSTKRGRKVVPPPGIPVKQSPLSQETNTRDLSERPPYVKDWTDY